MIPPLSPHGTHIAMVPGFMTDRYPDDANHNFHGTNINQIFMRRNRISGFLLDNVSTICRTGPGGLRHVTCVGAEYAFDPGKILALLAFRPDRRVGRDDLRRADTLSGGPAGSRHHLRAAAAADVVPERTAALEAEPRGFAAVGRSGALLPDPDQPDRLDGR